MRTRQRDVDVAPLTAEWRADARRVLQGALGGSKRIALLDGPDFGNVGDSLIGVGQRRLFEDAQYELVCALSRKDYHRARLRRLLGHDVVLLIHGGGNFGDLWPRHQRFRERLVQDFPDHQIVQLPQSVHFADPREAAASADLLRRHRNFTVLCRDHESVLAAGSLGLAAQLCPDMALVLPPFTGPRNPSVDVVVVRRRDKESVAAQRVPLPDGWHEEDWTGEIPAAAQAQRWATRGWRYLPARVAAPLSLWSFRRAFDVRVAYGLELVQRGRVVISDRLHVHVLCCLTGQPHAFVDNSYGKVSGLWRAWTHRVPFAQPCATWQEAIAWAESAVRQLPVITSERRRR